MKVRFFIGRDTELFDEKEMSAEEVVAVSVAKFMNHHSKEAMLEIEHTIVRVDEKETSVSVVLKEFKQ